MMGCSIRACSTPFVHSVRHNAPGKQHGKNIINCGIVSVLNLLQDDPAYHSGKLEYVLDCDEENLLIAKQFNAMKAGGEGPYPHEMETLERAGISRIEAVNVNELGMVDNDPKKKSPYLHFHPDRSVGGHQRGAERHPTHFPGNRACGL